MSIVARGRRARPTSSEPSSFEKFVAISNLVSALVLGTTSVVLGIVSFNLNHDFNEWQKKNSINQDIDQLKVRCVQTANTILLFTAGRNEREQNDILAKGSTANPECMSQHFNIIKYLNAFIVKNADQFGSRIVSRSAAVVVATTGRFDRSKSPASADRFALGQPQLRGFDISGVGPNVIRRKSDEILANSLGGKANYLGPSEVALPPAETASSEVGLRPCTFIDSGIIWKLPGCKSDAPRLTGVGVDWNSPFGPFRFDIATALQRQAGDETKTFNFSVGTQF
ncbi:BamA/TamA family outer membrane protein [Sandarakinorhabdus sp.]|uniref:BamA/TamA family outer membrane protein n=1 Tax=Sandarakinorhabdus sp. TaxID=1916663 RepID=UPI00286E16C3|nr:BamA/TamA family outer membrane protein [Sandarakinorhabdus sp.]